MKLQVNVSTSVLSSSGFDNKVNNDIKSQVFLTTINYCFELFFCLVSENILAIIKRIKSNAYIDKNNLNTLKLLKVY